VVGRLTGRIKSLRQVALDDVIFLDHNNLL
jgi:hypothetical protein